MRSNSVTRQVSFNRTKLGGKRQNSKTQMQHFEIFLKKKIFFSGSRFSYFSVSVPKDEKEYVLWIIYSHFAHFILVRIANCILACFANLVGPILSCLFSTLFVTVNLADRNVNSMGKNFLKFDWFVNLEKKWNLLSFFSK